MSVRIQLKEKDLFSFNMYHSYHRVQTWLFTILGIVIIGLSFTTYQTIDITYTLLYFFAGLIFIFYTPINLRTSAKLAMKMKNPISQAMNYNFSESGLTVAFAESDQEVAADATTSISWNQVFKVVETKKAIYLYTSPKNASILPKEQLGTQLDALKSILEKELESYKYGH